MMTLKKYCSYFIRYVFVLMILSLYVIEPMNASAASGETLQDLKDELKELQKEKAEGESEIELTESEIAKKEKEIENARYEIEVAKNEIEEAKVQIEEYNKKIEELDKQTKDLMAFYQIMSGNNVYMEFITDSSTMTDLIMRSDAVSQLTSYNKEKLNELEDLIEKNEALQVELTEKQTSLNAQIVEYEAKIDSLENSLPGMFDATMKIDEKIDAQKNLIAYYEDLGCKDDEELSVCEANIGTNTTWLKPLVKARVSSAYGYRYFNGKTKFHSGIDLAGNSEGTPIYSIGVGVVIAIRDAEAIMESGGGKSCGGNLVFIKYNILGETYTALFAHVLDIKVKVGDNVGPNTVVATIGGGPKTWGWDKGPSTSKPCTTGAHLHFELSKGTNVTTSKSQANSVQPPGYPAKGVWFYSRTQWFG